VISTFTLSGAYTDSGAASVRSSTENADGSSTEVHRLRGSDGTLWLQVELGADWYGVYRLGSYTVLSGNGAYSGLQGSGDVLMTSYEGGGWGYPRSLTVVYTLDNDAYNSAPTAVLEAGPGTYPLTVALSAYSSYDDDGIIVKYEWDLDNDGSFEWNTGAESSTIVAVAATGTYTFGLRVTDNDGATDTDYAPVTVGPPVTVELTAPAAWSTVSGTSVRLAATATNASFVRFYVGSTLVGTDSTSPYEVTWDSTTVPDGDCWVRVEATGSDSRVAYDLIWVTVANGTPPPQPLAVTGIEPDTMTAGSGLRVTVSGSGFAGGTTLTLVNGTGSTPVASAVVVHDSGTLSASITAGKRGPKGSHPWDVVVTHPDGRTATLVGGFTVDR
jgi:hypothetical protein